MSENYAINMSISDNDGKEFRNYIKELRAERDTTLEILCEGLCNHQMASDIENGRRVPDSLLQDAILERLGVGAENYEYYVDCREYDRWEARQKILNCIIYEEWDKAKQLLEDYQNTYEMSNKFEKQFVLSMYAQVRRNQGATTDELRNIFREAVDLTIVDVGKKHLHEMVLSLKELNLLLELEQYREGGQRRERYLEIMEYLQQHFDRIGVAKLYPKAVYLLCNCEGNHSPKTLLNYCDVALESLRGTSRMYYLWEILELRSVLIKKRIDRLGKNYPQKRTELWAKQKENSAWMEALRKAYDEFHVRKDTFEYCYLHAMKGVYCINDVIRIRRKMLNMTQKELWGKENDVKTIKRIEHRRTAPHRATVVKIFSRLGLSIEYAKSNLETAKPRVKQQMDMLMKNINNLKWEEAQELLKEVQEQVSVENRYNLQTLMQGEVYIEWKRKLIDDGEYYRRMRETLELTLPLEAFLSEGEKYLTHMEQTCIQNLMQGMDKESEKFRTCMRRFEDYYKPYVEKGLLQPVAGVYGFVMSYVASELGNMGEFDCSDKYNEIIIEGCLRFHRLIELPLTLYDRWWNYDKRKKEGIPTKKTLSNEKELNQVILLSNLGKQYQREQFYRDKLEKIRQNK